MKKSILLSTFLFMSFCYSQNKYSIGISGGFANIKKENGINENFFFGYNTSKNITIGIDGVISQLKVDGITLKSNIILPYIEGGIPEKGMIKDKLYFSGIVGIGYMEQKVLNDDKNSGTLFLGTKLNYKLSQDFLIGIKSGYYFSNLDNVIIGNLFLTYKL